MLRRSSTIALTIATLVSVSAADPAGPGAEPAAEVDDLASRDDDDAAAGRSYLAPTALTLPSGEAVLTLRVPLYPAIEGSIGFGVNERLEVSLGGAAAVIIEDESNNPDRFASVGAKLQLVRTHRFALGVTASAHRRPAYYQTDPFDEGFDRPRRVVGEIGGVFSVCADERCALVISGHAHHMPDLLGGDGNLEWGGASIVAGGGRHRLVADATFLTDGNGAGGIGYLGYRAASAKLSFDIGALLLADGNGALPWPTMGLSARF